MHEDCCLNMQYEVMQAEANKFLEQIAEEADARCLVQKVFEKRLRERHDEIQTLLMENRRERLRVEDMVLNFLQTMCSSSHFASEPEAAQASSSGDGEDDHGSAESEESVADEDNDEDEDKDEK